MGYTFYEAAQHGSLINMKWLYEKGCRKWHHNTFSFAAEHGSLGNMKWLYEKGCHWIELNNTLVVAARQNNLVNMKWLYEKGCPCPNAQEFRRFSGWINEATYEAIK